MRIQRLGWALSATLTLALTPAAARAQVIVRDSCLGSWDYCSRRDDIARQARDRAFERATRAEERARLSEARRDRTIDARIQAESRSAARAATMRGLQDRARDRQQLARERALDRRVKANLNRRLGMWPRVR